MRLVTLADEKAAGEASFSARVWEVGAPIGKGRARKVSFGRLLIGRFMSGYRLAGAPRCRIHVQRTLSEQFVDGRIAQQCQHEHGDTACAQLSIGNRIVTLAVISVSSTIPVTGARTTPVKRAAIPTTAKPSG